MPRYYNLHSHLTHTEPDCLAIQNVLGDFDQVAEHQFYSVGLHPWYLNEADSVFNMLESTAERQEVLAIGECGLDKVRGADWDKQTDYFRRQIKLANKVSKPLIIHCVRAFEEVMNLLKEEQVSVPVVFHGFRKKEQLAKRLLAEGYLLSIGAALLHDEALQALFAKLPPDRIFLETDDAAIPVEDLYAAAATIRIVNKEAIILQIQQNFKNTFGI